jgi:hypothetical protein
MPTLSIINDKWKNHGHNYRKRNYKKYKLLSKNSIFYQKLPLEVTVAVASSEPKPIVPNVKL